jgi:RHS repeat-associated protein
MTASPAGSYTNDILGNRLTGPGGVSMQWDELNRMTSFTNSSATTNYAYRADGLRVSKASASLTNYTFYDGQMPFQDIDVTSAGTAVTNNGLGARGVDYISKTQGSNTTTVFPILDGHGNVVCDLSRSGTNTFSLNDWRTYDAWGGIRSGANTGDPKQRFCGGLGHKQDDESGLIYMRARYYEPATGRFSSQDPARVGLNWFAYCNSNPLSSGDFTGREDLGSAPLAALMAIFFHAWNCWESGLANASLGVDKIVAALIKDIARLAGQGRAAGLIQEYESGEAEIIAESDGEGGEAGAILGLEGSSMEQGAATCSGAMKAIADELVEQIQIMIEITEEQGGEWM